MKAKLYDLRDSFTRWYGIVPATPSRQFSHTDAATTAQFHADDAVILANAILRAATEIKKYGLEEKNTVCLCLSFEKHAALISSN